MRLVLRLATTAVVRQRACSQGALPASNASTVAKYPSALAFNVRFMNRMFSSAVCTPVPSRAPEPPTIERLLEFANAAHGHKKPWATHAPLISLILSALRTLQSTYSYVACVFVSPSFYSILLRSAPPSTALYHPHLIQDGTHSSSRPLQLDFSSQRPLQNPGPS